MNPGSTNKYTKFGQLIISKFIKIIAARCHILRLRCSKFDSRRLSVRPSLRWRLTLTPQTGNVQIASNIRIFINNALVLWSGVFNSSSVIFVGNASDIMLTHDRCDNESLF